VPVHQRGEGVLVAVADEPPDKFPIGELTEAVSTR
jgi:hypothetical protein